jgi:ComF family protein
MLETLKKYIEGFISLFYPKFCFACNSTLLGNEGFLCTMCRHSLPITSFHKNGSNPVEKLFRGRIKIENATAFLFYDKGSKYGHLLHQFKYKGHIEIGLMLGEMFGEQLKETNFKDIDLIVPIPLHKAKLRKRGFNQSEIIAQGISVSLGKPVAGKALKRKTHTATQTKKGRYERWENVEGIFEPRDQELLQNKHILLIDDVITTGATLEAAGNAILEIKGAKLSIATLAIANG